MGRPAPRSKEQPRRAPGVDDMETQVGGERTLRAEQPLTMEQLSQTFGFVHYLTTLPATDPVLLSVGNVRDGPQVFLDGQPVSGPGTRQTRALPARGWR